MNDFQLTLSNWIRWARSGQPKHTTSWLGKLYRASKDEKNLDGTEWVSVPTPPVIPIDDRNAIKVEQAILKLPRIEPDFPYKRIDFPRLLVYHLVGDRRQKHFRRACRRLGVRLDEYDSRVDQALDMLRHRLTSHRA